MHGGRTQPSGWSIWPDTDGDPLLQVPGDAPRRGAFINRTAGSAVRRPLTRAPRPSSRTCRGYITGDKPRSALSLGPSPLRHHATHRRPSLTGVRNLVRALRSRHEMRTYMPSDPTLPTLRIIGRPPSRAPPSLPLSGGRRPLPSSPSPAFSILSFWLALLFSFTLLRSIVISHFSQRKTLIIAENEPPSSSNSIQADNSTLYEFRPARLLTRCEVQTTPRHILGGTLCDLLEDQAPTARPYDDAPRNSYLHGRSKLRPTDFSTPLSRIKKIGNRRRVALSPAYHSAAVTTLPTLTPPTTRLTLVSIAAEPLILHRHPTLLQTCGSTTGIPGCHSLLRLGAVQAGEPNTAQRGSP